MNFKGAHIVSARELDREDIDHILDLADDMIPIARGEKSSNLMHGKIMATLFYEPSTRTRFSFHSAMLRLGGSFLGFSDPGGTSVKKGETLADTIRMASSYSDLIILRHPQEGSARLASRFSDVPVINAGDGAGQHPTQTLLDLLTIRRENGKIDGRKIALVGDLKYGRTVHSLTYALAKYDADITFVAPPSLQMPSEVVDLAQQMGAKTQRASTLEDVVSDADVIYVTRIQRERFPDATEYQKVADVFKVNAALLENAKKGAIVMHPLPRVHEIDPDVDDTPYAAYFRQAFYGVPTRMALIGLVTGVLE